MRNIFLALMLPLSAIAYGNGPYPNPSGGSGGGVTTNNVVQIVNSGQTAAVTNYQPSVSFGVGSGTLQFGNWFITNGDSLSDAGGIVTASSFIGPGDNLTNSTTTLPSNTNSLVSAAQAAIIASASGGEGMTNVVPTVYTNFSGIGVGGAATIYTTNTENSSLSFVIRVAYGTSSVGSLQDICGINFGRTYGHSPNIQMTSVFGPGSSLLVTAPQAVVPDLASITTTNFSIANAGAPPTIGGVFYYTVLVTGGQ